MVWVRCHDCGELVFRSLSGPEVVVAHASDVVAQVIGVALIDSRFAPIRVRNGTQAMAVMLARRPAAIVLDVGLSDMMSFQLIEKIRAGELAGTKAILVASVFNKTAYKRRPETLYGADDYVEQHHIPDMLPKKLASLLNEPEPNLGRLDEAALQRLNDDESMPELSGRNRLQALARSIVADIALYHENEVHACVKSAEGTPLVSALDEGRRLLASMAIVDGDTDPIQEAFDELVRAMRGAMCPTETKGVAERARRQNRYVRAQDLWPDHPGAIAVLLDLLGDSHWRVRKAAVVAAARFSTDANLPSKLVDGLASRDNAGLRNACAEALVCLGRPVVAMLMETLPTQDADHRKFVVEALGLIGTAEARAALIAQLGDDDVNVRAAVAEALGHIGGTEAIEPLKAMLVSKDTELLHRVYILQALVSCGETIPFDEIQQWLGQRVLERQVLALLGRCADDRAIAPLLEGVVASSRETRAVGVCALAELLADLKGKDTGVVARTLAAGVAREAVLEALADPDDDVLKAAVSVLAATGDPGLAPTILLRCACRNVVEAGVRAVISMGSPVVKPLLEAFDSAPIEARVLFLEVIELVGDSISVPVLLEIAMGPDTRSSEAALRVVGKLAGVDVLPALMRVVREGVPEIAHVAAMSMCAIGRREADAVGDSVVANWMSGEVNPEWLVVLGGLSRDVDIEVIAGATHHRDPDVRCAAIDAARSYGTSFDEENVIMLLTDEHARVRASAARALGCYRSDTALAALLAASQDADPWVVAEAVLSLGGVGGDQAVRVLKDAAGSSVAPIAIAALKSLFRLNPPQLEAAVEKALAHADPEVVREAIAASVRLYPDRARELLGDSLRSRYWNVRAAAAEALVNRSMVLPVEQVGALLIAETEPLVQESLERLLRVAQEGE
ncbi:MAG: hypothetical protein A2289_00800 [Deltaproteobacteria bacterium RIFOXYA12_FULL_58_15]|nr:MAG: hypothetical protein A2289_00800 [Deltaproteobacteria bacterium RIFOXYA12_FULL_58_15]